MKPIIFNTNSVQAILEGRKTQTRRVVKPQPDKGLMPNKYAAPHKPGDDLWVKETWRLTDFQYIDGIWSASIQYKDGSCGNRLSWEHMDDERLGWRSSRYMRRAAARIFLRVTDVRVERVRDISEWGAIQEGCRPEESQIRDENKNPLVLFSAKENFAEIWDSLNAKREGGAHAWDRNPWVWVYAFERIAEEGSE